VCSSDLVSRRGPAKAKAGVNGGRQTSTEGWDCRTLGRAFAAVRDGRGVRDGAGEVIPAAGALRRIDRLPAVRWRHSRPGAGATVVAARPPVGDGAASVSGADSARAQSLRGQPQYGGLSSCNRCSRGQPVPAEIQDLLDALRGRVSVRGALLWNLRFPPGISR
jgi:hypothetical protein